MVNKVYNVPFVVMTSDESSLPNLPKRSPVTISSDWNVFTRYLSRYMWISRLVRATITALKPLCLLSISSIVVTLPGSFTDHSFLPWEHHNLHIITSLITSFGMSCISDRNVFADYHACWFVSKQLSRNMECISETALWSQWYGHLHAT